MLIHSSSQLLTLSGGPQRGNNLGDLGIIHNGAVLVKDGMIVDVGPTGSLINKYPDEPQMDAGNKVILPGFVDPHTHLIFAGDRAKEFEMRLQGLTYMQILASGGGILSTVSATRSASHEELSGLMQKRARTMLRYGTTTAEVKTGYGLTPDSELTQLRIIADYRDAFSPDLVATFLGAHAIPPEFKDDPWGYTHLITEEMLPRIQTYWRITILTERFPSWMYFASAGHSTWSKAGPSLKRLVHWAFH